MQSFLEYEIDDQASILILAEDDRPGVTQTSLDYKRIIIKKTKKSWTDAFNIIKAHANQVVGALNQLDVSEAEVRFGITTVGEVGGFAIGKLGTELNYEITLKWSKARKTTRRKRTNKR